MIFNGPQFFNSIIMTFISEEILERLRHISCEDVAKQLNLVVEQHRTLCFMHKDHHPSLSFWGSNRDKWFCFVCNKGGNAIDLVKEFQQCSFIEACSWLCNAYHIQLDDGYIPKYKSRSVPSLKKYHRDEEKKSFAKDVALFLIENCMLTETARHFLFDERKLSPKVISDLNIVSIDDGRVVVEKLRKIFDDQTLVDSGFVSVRNKNLYFRLFTPCLLFPYYNQMNDLIDLQSRYLGTDKRAPRFQFIASQNTHVYNLPILKSLKYKEVLYISEGITDCLALLSSGKKAVAIPSATILPRLDLSLLLNYDLRMFPDSDEAGERAFIKLQRFFIDRFSFLRAERLPNGVKDYSEYYRGHL